MSTSYRRYEIFYKVRFLLRFVGMYESISKAQAGFS
jgi:hypothetical protein